MAFPSFGVSTSGSFCVRNLGRWVHGTYTSGLAPGKALRGTGGPGLIDSRATTSLRRNPHGLRHLFTSHPNHATEPYPHRAVHARVSSEIQAADRLGYDTAWVAEHHFSNQYGIMPDMFTYIGYLAARTTRIRLGTAVVTLPLYDPIRVVENMAFVDILSGGRVMLGLGSGYRPYEFEGFGRDFERRRDVQEEAIDLILELLHKRRARHEGDAPDRAVLADGINLGLSCCRWPVPAAARPG
jgi:hypothetical protein